MKLRPELAQAQAAERAARAQVSELQERCEELERLVRPNSSDDEDSLNSARPIDESDAIIAARLRRQLAVYVSDSVALRRERKETHAALHEAHEALRDLALERDDLHVRVKDIEEELRESQAQCGELHGKHATEAEQRRAAELQRDKVETNFDVINAALEDSHGHTERLMSQKEEGILEAENRCRDAEKRFNALKLIVKPLKTNLDSLFKTLVEQTKEYELFVSNVKTLQQHSVNELKEGRQQLSQQQSVAEAVGNEIITARSVFQGHTTKVLEATKAEEELEAARGQIDALHSQCESMLKHVKGLQKDKLQLSEIVEELQAKQNRMNERRQRKLNKPSSLSVLEMALERNICKEMQLARQGVQVEKFSSFKKALTGQVEYKREPRFLQLSLSDTDSEENMLLRWGKAPEKLDCRLDLYEIIRIDYSCMSRPCILCQKNGQDVSAWLCFSLYTVRDSFDFVCPDEDTVRALILSISRLCRWADGTLKTRGNFEAAKAWCKIKDTCLKHCKSVCQLVIEAIHTLSESRSLSADLRPYKGGAKRAGVLADSSRTRRTQFKSHSSDSSDVQSGELAEEPQMQTLASGASRKSTPSRKSSAGVGRRRPGKKQSKEQGTDVSGAGKSSPDKSSPGAGSPTRRTMGAAVSFFRSSVSPAPAETPPGSPDSKESPGARASRTSRASRRKGPISPRGPSKLMKAQNTFKSLKSAFARPPKADD